MLAVVMICLVLVSDAAAVSECVDTERVCLLEDLLDLVCHLQSLCSNVRWIW